MTPEQKQTLKTHILANTTQLPFSGGTATIANVFGAANLGSGDAQIIADWYNGNASPDFFVWRDLPMSTVLNTYTPASMTPADAVPSVTSLPSNPTAAQNATYNNQVATLRIWHARATNCQGKQFNFQNLTIGRATAPMKNTSYRAGLQDALTNIPAGASGALISANWVGVRDAAKFLASNLEKVFATGTGSQATPADLVLEEKVTGDSISDIWGLA